jgi:hypothetical protein
MSDLIINPYSFDAYTVERDSQGRAIVNAKIMKAGRLKYKTADGKVWYGNISLDELKKAVPTASHKPVTIKHPPGLVTPKDFKKYQEGFSTDGYEIKEIDGEQWLTGPVILASEKAIQTAEDEKLGVSPGYNRKAVPTGVENEFDFVDIDINHIAIGCDNPRAKGASISLDEAEDDSARIYSFAKKQQTPKPRGRMAIKQKLSAVKVGAVSMDEAPIEYEEASENAIKVLTDRESVLIQALTATQESMDNAETAHKTEVGELSGANKILTDEVKDLKEKLENSVSMDEIETKIQELSDVRNVADRHKVDTKFTNVFDGMKAVVEKVSPGQSFDDAEIPGAYKIIAGNEKDAIERQKSKEALAKGVGQSMDSDNKKVSLSEVDVDALIKRKKAKHKQ